MGNSSTKPDYLQFSDALDIFLEDIKAKKSSPSFEPITTSKVDVFYVAKNGGNQRLAEMDFDQLSVQLCNLHKKRVQIKPLEKNNFQGKSKKTLLAQYNLGLIAPIIISASSIEVMMPHEFLEYLRT
ncbi:MAG: hypothetical protein V1765_01465 [bacterium]